MDKFEQKIQEIMKMSDRDRNNAIEHYKGSCICHTCATYDQCAAYANEKLFCVTGKSVECITKPKGCECPTCSLALSLDVGLLNNTFCLRGSEMDQRL
ncbi:DUF2769 domain-containing protein [Methanobacterium sp. SMA-27]|uniref:DUF2769 domain-containing protein n=1 Tax=Methanobacterium sp. SMA-27 TaxID=1495336 RepID=UPI00064F2669|nr:DUF2769 domain-containing protein [Methanobacterium sp. SMA-27]